MWNPYGGLGLLMPDFDEMKKSWRKATTSQKVARVGIVGSLIGAIVYAIVSTPRPSPQSGLPPEPVERAPAGSGRGHYR